MPRTCADSRPWEELLSKDTFLLFTGAVYPILVRAEDLIGKIDFRFVPTVFQIQMACLCARSDLNFVRSVTLGEGSSLHEREEGLLHDGSGSRWK